MTHTITLTREEEAALEAAARAVGRPMPEFLHGLIVNSLSPQGHAPSPPRDEAAVRRRMAAQWAAIDAEEDRVAAGAGADTREEAAA
jgi:hypothetical protein